MNIVCEICLPYILIIELFFQAYESAIMYLDCYDMQQDPFRK